MPPGAVDPRQRWRAEGAGATYLDRRFTGARHHGRDARLIADLVRTARLGSGSVLDAACGPGRLRPGLESLGLAWTGVDFSESMLAALPTGTRRSRADVARLPFRDGSFDLVVCSRLLHHLTDPERFDATLAELVRVARGHVVASFWDANTLPEWRRALVPRPGRVRVAHTKRTVRAAVERAGAELVAYRHSLRWLSRQTFFLARACR